MNELLLADRVAIDRTQYTVAAQTTDALDLVIRPGDMFVVAGPALSGKSRLLAVLAGIIAPDAGTVTTAHPHCCNLVPQHIALIDGLTIRDNILLATIVDPEVATPADWYDEVVGRLELEGIVDRRPQQTSYGQQHRAMLARSLCSRSDVLLVDEPFDHQDPEMATEIGILLHDYANDGHACITALRRARPEIWQSPDVTTIDIGRRAP